MRLMVLRATSAKLTCAPVVISPASTTRLSFTSVSAATRERGSCAKIASSTASEIWSATLSGWPSDTDSEVKRKSLIAGGGLGGGRKETKFLPFPDCIGAGTFTPDRASAAEISSPVGDPPPLDGVMDL